MYAYLGVCRCVRAFVFVYFCVCVCVSHAACLCLHVHTCGCVCRMHSQAARDIMRRTAGGECVCCVLGVRGVIQKCRQTEGGKDGERV